MDDKLKLALDFSNYMITLDNQKRVLQEKYEQDLIYYFNAGRFTVTQGLVSFVQSLLQLEQTATIIVDDNNIPVVVEDLQQFANSIVSVYWEATNQYLTEYNKLKTNRSVEGIFDV
jgi:hypothetical protein|tara:strand:- start:391 stop:738 length:348 start_codon:yes stop_codon:yes gene_type:complete